MKISKLHIDQFRHLENLDFDFTYQSGKRKGQPLDKICFIGQSATGKTSLLELTHLLVEYAVVNFRKTDELKGFQNLIKGNIGIANGEFEFLFNGNSFGQKKDIIFYKDKEYNPNKLHKILNALIPEEDIKEILYFKANLISDKNIELFTKNPIDLLEKHNLELKDIGVSLKQKEQYGILFDDNVDYKIWLFLLNEILNYRKNFTQKMSDFINKGILKNPEKFTLEFTRWQKDNPNKLESLAGKLNPLLEKLNLEIDLTNTEYSIPIRNKRTEEIIPIQNTSTGTKGLLLSFLPLFKLDTKDSIILIDEPERSLYPDMQMDLMDHYQNLAPDAQFIVATHSPFIAASFEADERFILYFDEEGKVAVRRGSSPIGDDPNDMLKNDFGVNYYNKHGEEAYQKYINLKQEVANETDPKRKKELLLETVKLGDTYNF